MMYACSSVIHMMGSCKCSNVVYLLSFTLPSPQPALLRGAHPQQSHRAASVDGFWSVFCFTVAMSCFNKCWLLGFLCFYSKLRMHACKLPVSLHLAASVGSPSPSHPFHCCCYYFYSIQHLRELQMKCL